MDLLSAGFALAVIEKVDWKSVCARLVGESISGGGKNLFRRLKPGDQEVAAKKAIELFVAEFAGELEDKLPLSASRDGYLEQVATLVESAAPEIAVWLQPETKDVDLGSVARMWGGMGLDPLPHDFDWTLVASNFQRAIRRYVKSEPEQRQRLSIALQEAVAEDLNRLAGPAVGFDLKGYRRFLLQKCSVLQLSVMHTSTYSYDRQVTLWSVFVPQTAREAVPVRDLPRDVLRELRREKHLQRDIDEPEAVARRERYSASSVRPVLETLELNRLVVVLGDPGSGKTSLLKYLALRWAKEDKGAIPLWIDLREYAQAKVGLLEYLESGDAAFGLDGREIAMRLQSAEAALYLDGLDEIFDGRRRSAVVEAIAAFAARFSQARVVVTSRIIGYEAERFESVGFAHATLEDFDTDQIDAFLSRWHAIAENDGKVRKQLSDRLHLAISDSNAIRELAGNPLLLTMMAILNRNQALPRDRVALYREASRVLLHEWDAHRALPVEKFDREDKEALLRELAGTMQAGVGGLAGNLIERGRLVEVFRTFLKEIDVQDSYEMAQTLVGRLTERNFILSYSGAERFSFVHRTFLEFYCASWFVHRLQVSQTLTFEALRDEVFGGHWRDEKWHEVLRLIAGMVSVEHAKGLIEYLIARPRGRWYEYQNLFLAAGCVAEVRKRSALGRVDETLRRCFTNEVIQYQLPYYASNFAKFMNERPIHIKAIRTIAIVWHSESVSRWLKTLAVGDQDAHVRRAAVGEVARGWKEDAETLEWLKERAVGDEGWRVRQAVVEEVARAWKEDTGTLEWLKARADMDEDEDVRRAALGSVASGWKEEAGTLEWLKRRAVRDEDWGVRRAAVGAVGSGWQEEAGTLEWLKARADMDEDEDVRRAAMGGVARGWKEDAGTLEWLKGRVVEDKHGKVRQGAVEEVARGWKEEVWTLEWLKERAVGDQDADVRQAAVSEVARGWKENAALLEWLKERAVGDTHEGVRWVVVREVARGWKEDAGTWEWLKELAVRDKHADVRRAVVGEVAGGWKEDAGTLEWLKELAVEDKDGSMRRVAVGEVSRGWKEDAGTLEWLKERAARDLDKDVRRVAVGEVARGWKEEAGTLAWLKERAARDLDENMRQVAVGAVARGWKEEAGTLAWLKERAVGDEHENVRQAAVGEVARGWKEEAGTLAWLKERAVGDEHENVRQVAVGEVARGWKEDAGTMEWLKERAVAGDGAMEQEVAGEKLDERLEPPLGYDSF